MKTVLITGVGRGIGKALMAKYLEEQYFVIGTYLTTMPTNDAPNAKFIRMDLGDSSSIRGALKETAKAGMKVDLLVNNAGVLFDEDETRLIPDLLRKTLEVNLIGTTDFTEGMISHMNEDSQIIFISSAAGSLGDMDHLNSSHFPYHYPAYKISKTALNMYARTLSARLVHENYSIQVSCIHPGWVQTDMGGPEATITPEEAAKDIFDFTQNKPKEDGQFWFKNKKYPW